MPLKKEMQSVRNTVTDVRYPSFANGADTINDDVQVRIPEGRGSMDQCGMVGGGDRTADAKFNRQR